MAAKFSISDLWAGLAFFNRRSVVSLAKCSREGQTIVLIGTDLSGTGDRPTGHFVPSDGGVAETSFCDDGFENSASGFNHSIFKQSQSHDADSGAEGSTVPWSSGTLGNLSRHHCFF